jgi:hypothetical protein
MRVAWSVLRPSKLNAPFGKLEDGGLALNPPDKRSSSGEEIDQQIRRGDDIEHSDAPRIAVLPFLKGSQAKPYGCEVLNVWDCCSRDRRSSFASVRFRRFASFPFTSLITVATS